MAWTIAQSGSAGPELYATLSEEALDDSSKELLYSDLSAPDSSHFLIDAVRVELTTTATVGNRLLEVRIEAESDSDVVYQVIVTSNSLAASLTKTWQFAPDLDEAVTAPQYVQLPKNLALYPGQKLVVEDQAAIDAAADDMVVHVMGRLVGR